MNDLYHENIIDHFKNPRNFGKLSSFDSEQKEFNTLCGDEVSIQLKVVDKKISEIKFDGNGCAISQAAASILTEYVKGGKVKDVLAMDKEDILKIVGINVGPSRLKCMLISLYAIKNALLKIKNA